MHIILQVLIEWLEKMNIVGFDFVEVNPKLDVGTNITSYLGALTVAMFLGFIDHYRRTRNT